MKKHCRAWLRRKAKKAARRLRVAKGGQAPRKGGRELAPGAIRYETSDRVQAIPCGGIGVVHSLVRRVGLAEIIDDRLPILMSRRPYSESDHVLNIAYNILCGGAVLDDIEVRRSDVAFLDAVGARRIPDPTTAGDFCRRFSAEQIETLMDLLNEIRQSVWRRQPATFLAQTAKIDADGSVVPTRGECKHGIGLSYNGIWGYHPLVVSLSNTGEPLFVANRSGNRPSQEGAPDYFARAIEVVRGAGFRDVLLRGDTAFSQAAHFDRWTADGVRFVFGYDAVKQLVEKAEAVSDTEYTELRRKADEALDRKARTKQPRVKEAIISERGYRNLRLEREEIAEFEHKPTRAKGTYRIVVLCKSIIEERGQIAIGHRDRYFFFVTNDRSLSAEEVVREANTRCNQENLIEQLKNGVRSLRAPLNTLEANWAYMVMASLAWSLKAWVALWPASTRAKHQAERERILKMEFRSFLQRVILVPAQILKTGRSVVYRLLSWRPELPILFRVLDAL